MDVVWTSKRRRVRTGLLSLKMGEKEGGENKIFKSILTLHGKGN